jgi:hypothetical protein
MALPRLAEAERADGLARPVEGPRSALSNLLIAPRTQMTLKASFFADRALPSCSDISIFS